MLRNGERFDDLVNDVNAVNAVSDTGDGLFTQIIWNLSPNWFHSINTKFEILFTFIISALNKQ